MMRKGIIPIMSGGLGNQMFIMASAYIVSIVSNYPLYILKNTLENNKHNIHKYDYNKTIFKYFGIAINLEYTKLKQHVDFKDYIYHSHNFSNGFEQWNPYDIEWIKEKKLFKGNIFRIVENLDELQTMLLMSLCKGGAICSNSTFCWWGAYLGTYEKRNPVFVPKKWISVKDDMSNLFPSEWIII